MMNALRFFPEELASFTNDELQEQEAKSFDPLEDGVMNDITSQRTWLEMRVSKVLEYYKLYKFQKLRDPQFEYQNNKLQKQYPESHEDAVKAMFRALENKQHGPTIEKYLEKAASAEGPYSAETYSKDQIRHRINKLNAFFEYNGVPRLGGRRRKSVTKKIKGTYVSLREPL